YLHPALFSAGQRRYFFVYSFKRRLHYSVARLGVKNKQNIIISSYLQYMRIKVHKHQTLNIVLTSFVPICCPSERYQ
uniref:Uncharacterized protein n=1 Tax=Ciona intestinalis TaxID=7719 RepID=H2XU31_CIOIN